MRRRQFILTVALAAVTCLAGATSFSKAQHVETRADYGIGVLAPDGPRGADGRHFATYVRNLDPALQYTVEVASDDFDPRVVVADGARVIAHSVGMRGGAPARVVLPRGTGGNVTIYATPDQPFATGRFAYVVSESRPIPAPGDRLAGRWRGNYAGFGPTSWTFTHLGGGIYEAQEHSHAGARGRATLVGNQVRIEWAAGSASGTSELILDPSGRHAAGRHIVRSGPVGTYEMTLARE